MVMAKVGHPSVTERRAKGKGARELTPLFSHGGWAAAPDRPDPVALLEAQNVTRVVQILHLATARLVHASIT